MYAKYLDVKKSQEPGHNLNSYLCVLIRTNQYHAAFYRILIQLNIVLTTYGTLYRSHCIIDLFLQIYSIILFPYISHLNVYAHHTRLEIRVLSPLPNNPKDSLFMEWGSLDVMGFFSFGKGSLVYPLGAEGSLADISGCRVLWMCHNDWYIPYSQYLTL